MRRMLSTAVTGFNAGASDRNAKNATRKAWMSGYAVHAAREEAVYCTAILTAPSSRCPEPPSICDAAGGSKRLFLITPVATLAVGWQNAKPWEELAVR
jgi:hypothetical protein